MTKEKAREIIAKYPNAISFVKNSHLEELSPLVEVHIEVVEVKKEDFHILPGGNFYPKKETTDRFGNAAGISFARVETSTRKDGDAYIGKAIPQEVGPDGKMIQWAPAEYEFDPEVRAEEDILRKPETYDTDAKKRLKVLDYRKCARRRADTGARAAAIISAIGMPTGLKNLFTQNDPPTATRIFLFSRIIANTKNELVLNRALDNMFGATNALYGGSFGQSQIAAPEVRNVSPGEAETDEFDDFGDFEGTVPTETEERKEILMVLEEYLNSDILPKSGKDQVTLAMKHDGEYTIEQLRDLRGRCEKVKRRREGGAA